MRRRACALALLGAVSAPLAAVEQRLSGLVDLRLVGTDGISSYVDGDYGKFRFNDGSALVLGQAALAWRVDWDGGYGLTLVGNAHADGVDDGAGLTEGWVDYRGLPSAAGYRARARLGWLYPRVTLSNRLVGWATPYTLSYSTIDAWLAEELRHQGLEIGLDRLGRLAGSAFDLNLSLTVFRGNDPAGAMLAWHGWVLGSRQSAITDKLALPNTHIGFVPDASEPFIELDDRFGYHVAAEIVGHGRSRWQVGYYDNRADPTVVNEDTQWGWRTRFYHVGAHWRLADELDLLAQYLAGDTLMQSRSGRRDLVANDYHSGYLLLSRAHGRDRYSLRLERFGVEDRDEIGSDINDEDGNAVTLNLTRRLDRRWRAAVEFNWVDSERPSRTDHGHPERLIERQLQFALRYFFRAGSA